MFTTGEQYNSELEPQLQSSDQTQEIKSVEIYQTKPPLKNFRLVQKPSKESKGFSKKASSGASSHTSTTNWKKREMAYAGIYGDSLIKKDKNILKNLGIQNLRQNRLLVAQEQRMGNQYQQQPYQNKKRKQSKNRGRTTQQVEQHLVLSSGHETTQNADGSVAFGLGGEQSTKRGAFESELGNSREMELIG